MLSKNTLDRLTELADEIDNLSQPSCESSFDEILSKLKELIEDISAEISADTSDFSNDFWPNIDFTDNSVM